MSRRVWIAQCLCPQRHCIAALVGEADHADEAQRTLGTPLEQRLDTLIPDSLNPWCGICHADRESWRIELGRTRYRTLAEADAPLRQQQSEQMLTSHGPQRPKPN